MALGIPRSLNCVREKAFAFVKYGGWLCLFVFFLSFLLVLWRGEKTNNAKRKEKIIIAPRKIITPGEKTK